MTLARTALVIGAGIAGPATAIALQKAGVAAEVYDAHPTGAEGAGVFLTVGSNGLDALRILGAAEPVLAAGFPTPGITLRSGTGRRLGQSPTGGTLPGGTTSQTLKRADLYGALHREALARGIRMEHGKRLVGAHDTGEGVRAVFADGSEAAGDLLVGCDGVHSTVRRIIDPDAPAPRYAGLMTTGGYARGVQVDADPGRYEMIFGRRAFFGYAVAPGGEVWWFANVPWPEEPARGAPEAVGGEDWRRHLAALYAGDAGPAVEVLRATPELAAMTPLHSVPHLPTWHDRRKIVIGDAAHAPSPTSGQGASLALEDALVLAKCLRDAPDVADAFARFEAARRPRVERIIKAAGRMNSSKAAGPVRRVLRDAMLPAVLRMTAHGKAQRQVYDYRVDWDAAAT